MPSSAKRRVDLDLITRSGTPGAVGIVGLGLIGGSLAKAYAEAGVTVYAANRTRSTLEAAIAEGSVAAPLDDSTIELCDLVVIALYPQATVDWVRDHADAFATDALVVDCGGVKRAICAPCFAVASSYGFHFIGGHPMAGIQYSGFRHARVDLFAGQSFVIVPPEDCDRRVVDACIASLSPCGFKRYSIATPERHDEIIAYTSQLAHVVSSAFIKSPTARAHSGFSAGSYRDLTRVAELNAGMWTELFCDNADYLSLEIERVIKELARYKDALDARDADTLEALLADGTRAKRRADGRFSDGGGAS